MQQQWMRATAWVSGMLHYAVARHNSNCRMLHACTQPRQAQRKHRAVCTAQGRSMQLFGLLRLLPVWYLLTSTLSSLCSCPRDAAMTSTHGACMPNKTCSQVPEHVQLPWLMRAPLQQVSAGTSVRLCP